MDIAIIVLICVSIVVGLLNLIKKFNLSQNQKSLEIILKKLSEENKLTREALSGVIKANIEGVYIGVKSTNEAILDNVKNIAEGNHQKITEMKEELARGLNDIKYNVRESLKEVREDNQKQLSEMRNVVDEKLSSTLNERLAQSFKVIGDRLDKVNKGFNDIQQLSAGVTDLKKSLSNVKKRGVWGEISLENLLDGVLTKDQYVKSCDVSGKGQERVDFAIILPGKGKDRVYLPIDVKFPTEDYQRLLDATETGDLEKCSECVKALERTIKEQAKSISKKYINPPHTTDYAIMYLPIEGLYAEVLRISGLVEELQNRYRIIPAGPSNTAALLNSLQMGFRSMAIKKSSIEVFKIFMEFKKDFGIFIKNIGQVKEQLDKANTTWTTRQRTNIIQKN